MKLAGASLNQTPIDWDTNYQHILQAIDDARSHQVDLLCLPELCIPSYGCQDLFLAPWVSQKSLDYLLKIVPHTQGIAVTLGFPYEYNGKRYNACALVGDATILGVYAKQILANEGVHYEPRWFTPWPAGQHDTIVLNGQSIPFGDIELEWKGERIAFEICEDAWHEEVRPGNRHRQADIILNPSASHFALGKAAFREKLITESSAKFACTYVYANLLGNESGRMIFDGDVLIARNGTLLARSSRLGFASHELVIAGTTALTPAMFDANEEFTRAQSLGLFDYLRKSYSQGFVLSLSGGADSSCVAVLVAEMVKRAVEERGLEGFKAALSHIPSLEKAQNVKELVHCLLTCVYQSTTNSSEETAASATALANGIGAEFHHWSVEKGVRKVTKVLEKALGRHLTWEQDDIALQNIQARIRAPYIWMLANVKNSLLLATSNRSEAAVGYATMDGDTSGSISPIAGIDKHFILQWLRWAENHLQYAALSYVNALQPSAELRPPDQSQTDEADLMPYEVLNKIEQLFVFERKSPSEIYTMLSSVYGADTQRWIDKFLRLWQRNQWKRERYAPSFHLDAYSLDPKSWARFPILAGSYEPT